MWRVLRPDARSVWNNPEALKRLGRYRGIIDQERWSKYLVTKSLDCSIDLNSSTNALWNHHRELSNDFNEQLQDIDSKSGKSELEESNGVDYLSLKIELAQRILQDCHFCERKCGANRTKNEKGWCKLGETSRVSSAFLHTGEEAPLVPSGTIFFASCCFGCVFCQNYDISTNPNSGQAITPMELAAVADKLYQDGALNINYVGGDPIPNTHAILASMRYQTANVTQLWNSNLYCSEDTMHLLMHVFDVWLPDFKYGNNKCAERLSGVKNYFDVVSRNHLMAYQSGEVIVRHLVLPNHIECCTFPILNWISKNMPNCLVNIMGQYRPEHRVRRESDRFRDIARGVSREEMKLAFDRANELGICWRPVS